MRQAYSDEEFVGVTWYTNAPYFLDTAQQRFIWYGFSGTPSCMFDGVAGQVGGSTQGSTFPEYNAIVQQRLLVSSPLTLQAAFVITPDDMATLTVSVLVDETVTTSLNVVQPFVIVDGMGQQQNLVVAVPDDQQLTVAAVGESQAFNWEIPLDPDWASEGTIGFVIVVQSLASAEVLQAGYASPDYAGTVIVDGEPDGVQAPWQLAGPDGFLLTDSGDKQVPVFGTGDYTLTWQEVPAWTSPPSNPQIQTLLEDGEITFTGIYTDGPFAVVDAGPLGDGGPARGVALVDFDDDGDLDIHVVNAGAADQLLRNDGELSFTDVASGLIADAGLGQAAAWADLNGDGHQDVFLSRDAGEASLLLVGDGEGGFAPASVMGLDDTGAGRTATWLDYDGDGDLDLYQVLHEAPNRLYQNFGTFGDLVLFQLVTGPAAVAGPGTGLAAGDYDGDGDLDLYLPRLFASNVLLEYVTGLGFNDVTTGLLGDPTGGQSAAWGDYNNDGELDLYVANTGGADLLISWSSGFFNQIVGPGLGDPGAARNVAWADFDLDGDLDLFLTRFDQPDRYLRNEGADTFLNAPVGWPEAEGPGQSCAVGDLDGDGDLDVAIVRDGASNLVLRNEQGGGNHWLQLELEAVGGTPEAIGARVTVHVDGGVQVREVTSGTGNRSQHASAVHFGFGQTAAVDSVVIRWPDGTPQTLVGLAVDRFWEVVQGEDPNATPVEETPAAVTFSAGRAYPNPFNPRTTIAFSVDRDGPVRVEVFTIDGRRVRTLVQRDLQAGRHEVLWDGLDGAGRPVPSGSYLYRVVSGERRASGRMMLVR